MLKLMPWCQLNGADKYIYIYRLALYIVRYGHKVSAHKFWISAIFVEYVSLP